MCKTQNSPTPYLTAPIAALQSEIASTKLKLRIVPSSEGTMHSYTTPALAVEISAPSAASMPTTDTTHGKTTDLP